jgi:hypothetical protein
MSYAKRMRWTDQDEILIYAVRPIALTSVVEIIVAPDLGDRAITIVPPRIDEENRREEAEVLAAFEKEHPEILAAFLDAVAHGLRMMPTITNTRSPRMADFAKWATACEGAYDPAGTFLQAYGENRTNAVNALVAEDMVGSAVMRLPLPWEGQIGMLLEPLAHLAGDQTKSREWPKTPRGLGSALRRLVPFLRDCGVEVEVPGRNDKTRTWSIRAVAGPIAPTAHQQPDQQPEDKPLKTEAEIEGPGGLGGSGGSLHHDRGRGRTGGNGDTPGTPLIGNQQPEQPEAAVSRNVPSDLSQGDLSGCSPTGGPQPPEQPDVGCGDIPPFLRRPPTEGSPGEEEEPQGQVVVNGFAISSSPDDRREPEPGQIFTRIRIRTIEPPATTEPAIIYNDTVETY